ncbi:hypothetical protein ACFWNN_13965 [Lentzea sp. NPDC058450]|uniref:hypothetical protein n=1 Tax=Lentzea sp. NPDC058450 TaxID=3346505 RepID=UPI00365D2AA7
MKEKSAWDVVFAACDLVVEDVPAPSLAVLAAVSRREADIEVPIRLREVLPELGLDPLERGTVAAKEAALRAQARRALTGELAPRDLAKWPYEKFGYAWIDLTTGLSWLDDDYESGDRSDAEIDADVLAEARRLTA